MTKNILVLIIGLVVSGSAFAQEWGAAVGVHQTSADVDSTGTTVDSKLGFKLGMNVGFELGEGMKFRSGFLYNQRHFETNTGAVNAKYNFDYIDVPADFQYNINDMVGFFGGLVIGINVQDEVKVNSGTAADPDADKLIPIANAGVNLTFSDMIGFDFYYERGLGDVADHVKDFSTFGANFIYWF
jgi:hypothetical protein